MVSKQKETLRAVAKLAGVSTATVSRVMNRTVRVSTEVEKRVREAAEKLGYDLERKNSAKLIAYLLGNRSLLHPFHSQVLIACEAYCNALDYNFLFLPIHYAAQQNWSKLHLPSLLERTHLIDGFVSAGVTYPNLLEVLDKVGLPFVVLGDTVQGEWDRQKYDAVFVDDQSGAYELTRYLLSLGHTSIAFVANTRLAWFARRAEGYRRAMAEAGYELLTASIDSENEREVGFLATKQILQQTGGQTGAIFAGSDAICHGTYAALREANLRIPDDISVSGFNDTAEATLLYPALTSVRVFPDLVGRLLGEILLARIRHGAQPPIHRTIPTEIIKRDSCRHGPILRHDRQAYYINR